MCELETVEGDTDTLAAGRKIVYRANTRRGFWLISLKPPFLTDSAVWRALGTRRERSERRGPRVPPNWSRQSVGNIVSAATAAEETLPRCSIGRPG